MKTAFKILSILLALCAAASAAEPIRVLTFNILAAEPKWETSAKQRPWSERKPAVLEIMRQAADGAPYDFIGTQESAVHPNPDLHQARQLAAALPQYGSFHIPCSGEPFATPVKKFSISNQIFWLKNRWEIDPEQQGVFWLSDTPEKPGSNTWGRAPDGKFKGGIRNVAWGLFHELDNGKRTGKRVYFFNTHLNVFIWTARTKSAFLIAERIQNRADKTAPVILTGDFNFPRHALAYKYLSGEKINFENKTHTPPLALVEAYAAANPDDKLPPKIDFIFTTPDLKPLRSKIITAEPGGIRPSDHRPVETILQTQ